MIHFFITKLLFVFVFYNNSGVKCVRSYSSLSTFSKQFVLVDPLSLRPSKINIWISGIF
jgi:hypothetical protein